MDQSSTQDYSGLLFNHQHKMRDNRVRARIKMATLFKLEDLVSHNKEKAHKNAVPELWSQGCCHILCY